MTIDQIKLRHLHRDMTVVEKVSNSGIVMFRLHILMLRHQITYKACVNIKEFFLVESSKMC